jgi:hypothetical protein
MRRWLFGLGLAVFLAGSLVFLLEGAPSPYDRPILPEPYYGLGQLFWMAVAIAGLLLSIFGAVIDHERQRMTFP